MSLQMNENRSFRILEDELSHRKPDTLKRAGRLFGEGVAADEGALLFTEGSSIPALDVSIYSSSFSKDRATVVSGLAFYGKATDISALIFISQLTVSQGQIARYWPRISERFDTIRQREDKWDEYGSKKPNSFSLSHAESLVGDLLNSVILAGYPWRPPFISSDEEGHITIEWHKGKHDLHIEVRENEAEYIKIWGANIESEMYIDFLSKDSYLTLWKWLLNG